MSQKEDKYNKILDALQTLLEDKGINTVTMKEIAQTAGIGKSTIYYYFPNKDAILEALVKRDYEKPIETARHLEGKKDISPFTRMAMIFEACRNSSAAFLRHGPSEQTTSASDRALLHQKYMKYLIHELKPTLGEIIWQATQSGEAKFSDPHALAEIVLIVLTVELDNSLLSTSQEEVDKSIRALIELLEKGTENPSGSLNFLSTW